jgi:hypothetical protein
MDPNEIVFLSPLYKQFQVPFEKERIGSSML